MKGCLAKESNRSSFTCKHATGSEQQWREKKNDMLLPGGDIYQNQTAVICLDWLGGERTDTDKQLWKTRKRNKNLVNDKDYGFCIHGLKPVQFIIWAVAQEEEQSSANWNVAGLTPGFLRPHVEVSLGKTLNSMLHTDVSIRVWICVIIKSTV